MTKHRLMKECEEFPGCRDLVVEHREGDTNNLDPIIHCCGRTMSACVCGTDCLVARVARTRRLWRLGVEK